MYVFSIFFQYDDFRYVINIRDKKFIKAFGEKVKELRTKNNISQEELANDADIPINQIGRIERGEINTTISTIYAISKALKIHHKDLMDFTLKD